MSPDSTGPPEVADLSQCDREPIHIPGSIQPQGWLLALDDPGLVVLQVSRNVEDFLEIEAESLVGQPVEPILGPDLMRKLRQVIDGGLPEGPPLFLARGPIAADPKHRPFDVIVHRSAGVVIVELEAVEDIVESNDFQPSAITRVSEAIASLDLALDLVEACRMAAAEVRRLTGFDRVLIYRFEENQDGTVIAEDRNEVLPSYLGLRFPASDIPQQARELYLASRIRLIADASYQPSPLVPALRPDTGQPLDLRFATLRSVSPVHVEYMTNMGTASSMSISILQEGRLWGLIACHGKMPRVVPFEVRKTSDFLGQVLSIQITSKQHRQEFEVRLRRKSVLMRLLGGISDGDDFVDDLVRHEADLLSLVDAEGAAILHDGDCRLIGLTPSEEEVGKMADWLELVGRDDIFATDSISSHLPMAESFKDQAAGLLAIATSKIHRGYLFWFRPEIIRTVNWGGDPSDTVVQSGRIHPRKSFESWKEIVRLKSSPWEPGDLESAVELRNAIVGIVLRRAEERAQLSAELERSNKELEAFSYSVSHDLRAPFRHIVGYSEMLREEEDTRLSAEGRRYVDTIIESAQYAGTLVDNLLAFSRMGRTTIHPAPIDMNLLMVEVIRDVMTEANGRSITWNVGPLPPVEGDLMMMRLALSNLASNAVKYTRTRSEAVVEVGSWVNGSELVYFIRDNGIGFDMRYAGKLFGVFQRLHKMEEYEGTGIGLANVRRIMSRHGGRAWAEGEVNRGSTFYFALPKVQDSRQDHDLERG
jgi:light-regulated signal transduction histidine kinase (bacteriophytochrome)